MSSLDLVELDTPADVVDRLLWRTAQRILNRHAVRLDGTCHWCARPAPCDAHKLAIRAAEVARLPWHEAWHLRNEITGMLPVVTAELRSRAPSAAPTERARPVARSRTRTWIRVRVVRESPPTGAES
jgi:hypothetical protein